MRSIIVIAAAAAIGGCGQGSESSTAANNVANAAEAEKPRPAYCFFKDEETEKWSASRDATGNIVVAGKAFRSDPRYKAALGEPIVSGTTVEVAPTIVVNDTGYASPDNWWDVKLTIADSSAVETVKVTCGAQTIATLSVPRKK